MAVYGLLLLYLWTGVLSDHHSLRYYYTGVSGPGYGIPEFSIVGYVDDQQIDLYSSDIGRNIPMASWMKKGDEHWSRETQIAKSSEALFRHDVRTAMSRFNQTEVQPQVKVSGQEKGGAMKLHCQVYGFHPQAVYVKWMKNGEDEVHSYETTHVLPNPDGTYQIRVSAEVNPKKEDYYVCYVDHSSLEEPLLIQWEPIMSSFWEKIMIIFVLIVMAITVSFVGFLLYRKRKGLYKAPSGEGLYKAPSGYTVEDSPIGKRQIKKLVLI